MPNFILDFKTSQTNSEINLFLTKKTYSKNIGASYTPSDKELMLGYVPLIDKFDGIVFFKKISPLTFSIPMGQTRINMGNNTIDETLKVSIRKELDELNDYLFANYASNKSFG